MAHLSYFTEVEVGEGFEPFAFLRDTFGLVPNIFRAQTLLPRLIEAQLPIVPSGSSEGRRSFSTAKGTYRSDNCG